MKRVAVCLYGRFGNRFDHQAGYSGIQYLLKSVTKGTLADFFVYSYDVDQAPAVEEALGNLLTDSAFPDAPNLLKEFIAEGGDPNLFSLSDSSRGVEATLSFVSQRDGAIRLMTEWARQKSVSYDSVLVSRIDLGQIDKHNQRFPQRVSEAPNIASLNSPSAVYHAAWNQLNEGLPDQWFILSQSDAALLGSSLERFKRYLKPQSEYINWCSKGIEHSNLGDPFTNEQTAVSASSDLSIRLPMRSLDNHLLHKFDFIKVGLFEKLRPAFDSHGIAQLTYTHSSYLDGFALSRAQQDKHLGSFSAEYIAIENGFLRDSSIPENARVLKYDDTLSYTERLRSVVKNIDEDFVFFMHEDMPLLKTPVVEALLSAKELLTDHEQNAVVRMIRVGLGLKLNVDRPSRTPFFCKISRFSPWQFSIQPSLWKKSALITLLDDCQGLSVWDFEVQGQVAFRRLRLRGFQPITAGPRRGKHHHDSLIYPYVATAIVKGRWNSTEYPELPQLIGSVDLSRFPNRDSLSKP